MELFKKQQQMSNLKRLNVGFIIGFDTVQFIILFIVNKIVDDWIWTAKSLVLEVTAAISIPSCNPND